MSSTPTSSVPCVIDKCELVSLALCQCCRKDLCIDHLNEHANQRNEKLLPLADKINFLLSRFNQFYASEQSEVKQLEQWRQEALKTLDQFYEKKRQELLDETTDKQREQLNEMQTKLNELIRKKGGSQKDFDQFTENLQLIEQYLDNLEHGRLVLPPLTINEQCFVVQSNDLSEKPAKIIEEKTEKSSNKKERSKKKRKSSRTSDHSSDRSSRHRSRSPRRNEDRSRRRRRKSRDSNSSPSSSNNAANCEDCHDCRFYQDRFGPGFMDSFGPCKCKCHTWAYT